MYLIAIAVICLAVRLVYLLNAANKMPSLACRNMPAKTMVVIGSGGHTTEMMVILRQLDKTKYWPRTYISAANDTTSDAKITDYEHQSVGDYAVHKLFRCRNVHQSFVSAIGTTAYAILSAIPIMCRERPDLILCNGPGTCVPVCLVGFLLKLLYVNADCRIVFVESYCRVRTLSLSGRILIWCTDLFVVQWKHLSRCSSKVKYFGRLS